MRPTFLPCGQANVEPVNVVKVTVSAWCRWLPIANPDSSTMAVVLMPQNSVP